MNGANLFNTLQAKIVNTALNNAYVQNKMSNVIVNSKINVKSSEVKPQIHNYITCGKTVCGSEIEVIK